MITSFIAHFCLPLMKLFWTHSDISYLILIPQVFIYHSINMHISDGILIYLTVLSIRRISLNIGWGDLLIHNFLKLEISNSPLNNVISNNFLFKMHLLKIKLWKIKYNINIKLIGHHVGSYYDIRLTNASVCMYLFIYLLVYFL